MRMEFTVIGRIDNLTATTFRIGGLTVNFEQVDSARQRSIVLGVTSAMARLLSLTDDCSSGCLLLRRMSVSAAPQPARRHSVRSDRSL